MPTDPLHVKLGSIIDIYMMNVCAKSYKDAGRERLPMGGTLTGCTIPLISALATATALMDSKHISS